MADKKKKPAPPKKGSTRPDAVKAPKKKTGAVAAAKGKTPRRPKLTKPASKPVTKKTAVSRKPAAKKVAALKKTPVKAKVAATAKPKAVSKTPAVADALREIRRSLIIRREAIVKEAKDEIAKYISGENRQLVDTALDDGDWAVVDISEDINLRRLAAHRKALHDIDESIRKIEEGSYGICEECGEEIGEKRLKVLPTATLCVVCQGNKERLEAIENAGPSV
ncbi:MAG: TraR/DksA family transcriptional regulator [Thermodesulfovibrionales bacterium]